MEVNFSAPQQAVGQQHGIDPACIGGKLGQSAVRVLSLDHVINTLDTRSAESCDIYCGQQKHGLGGYCFCMPCQTEQVKELWAAVAADATFISHSSPPFPALAVGHRNRARPSSFSMLAVLGYPKGSEPVDSGQTGSLGNAFHVFAGLPTSLDGESAPGVSQRLLERDREDLSG